MPVQLDRGRSRSLAVRDERDQLLAAVVDAVDDYGYASTTVDDVVRRAGVSSEVFDEHFGSVREALLAAHGAGGLQARDLSAAVFLSGSDWPDQHRRLRRARPARERRPDPGRDARAARR